MRAPASGRVVLIRHGRTEWNANRRFQGQLDIPLDSVGLSQASAVASGLAASGAVPVAMLCSDSGRAFQTASIVAAALGVSPVVDPRLREIFLGGWQGLDTAEAAVKFPEEYAAWRRGEDVRRGGGETYAEVAARAWEAVSPVVSDLAGGTVVVVTHGGTSRALTGLMTGLPHARWAMLGPLSNCHLTVLGAAGERGWRLRQHNASVLAD